LLLIQKSKRLYPTKQVTKIFLFATDIAGGNQQSHLKSYHRLLNTNSIVIPTTNTAASSKSTKFNNVSALEETKSVFKAS